MVIIKMDMPKACGSCPLREETDERVYNLHCKLLRYKYVHPDYQNRRLTDCPIKGDFEAVWDGLKTQIDMVRRCWIDMAKRCVGDKDSDYLSGYLDALEAVLVLMGEYEEGIR